MRINTLNTNELSPEYYYIFTDRYSEKLATQIEQHNINLRDGTLISSGFSNVLSKDTRKSFLDGDIDYLPFVQGTPTTVGPISPFVSRVIERYTLEYNIEMYRRAYFKHYPSRLSCIFAFGDYGSCESMAGKKNWNIDAVKRYQLKDMGCYNNYIKIVKTNFKIIGALESYGTTSMTKQTEEAIEKYWAGEGSITIPELAIDTDISLHEKKCGERWEYLIEGILEEVPLER